jgi:NAD(P)H-flavin reductase
MAAKARECRARVVATRRLAPAVLEADLGMDDPPRFDFDAGQWISVPFGPKTVRAYTVASTPRDASVVTLCADVAPAGIGSRWFSELAAGAAVSFKGPLGGFVFDRADPRAPIFVAEEIGVVPIRSILMDLDEAGIDRPATLITWAPDPEGHVYHRDFAALARRRAGFVYHPVVAEGGAGWDGARGALLDTVERLAPADPGVVVYVAGGEATIKRVREVFVSRGLERKAIKWERFW